MNTRPYAAAFFVVFCLLLCGLILRRQITAHPLPPSIGQQGSIEPQDGGRRGFGMDFQDFHPAPAALAAQVQATIQGQIAAMSAGDGPKALSYQSQRRNLPDPALFIQLMQRQWPEFGRNKAVQFGQVLVNGERNQALARVTAESQSGQRIQGIMLLVREGGQFKIDGFNTFGRQDAEGHSFLH